MDWLSYQVGVRLARAVRAAMMRADTANAAKLRAAWPTVWDDTQARYDAPGGLLVGETMTPGMHAFLEQRGKVLA